MRWMIRTDLERFEEKLDKQENGCWIWAAARSTRYGSFYFPSYPRKMSKDMVAAHKAAYYLYKGIVVDFPDEVMHSCDNGYCCNPEHLSVGSHTDNMRDMAAKGRNVPSKQVLSPENVAECKKLRGEGWQVKTLAEKFGISDSQMSRVVKGCWTKFKRGVLCN